MKALKRLIIFLSLICLMFSSAYAEQRVFIAPEESRLDNSKELMHIYVLDLIGADCMLIRYKDNNMLVDLGKSNQFYALNALLQNQNIKEVSVFNSHPHKDHIGGIFNLIDNYKVTKFYTGFPEFVEDSPVQAKALRKLSDHNIPIQTVHDGDSISFDEDISMKVLQNGDIKNTNEKSAMLHITYGEAKLLLTGDISWNSQGFFAQKYGKELDSDIMKAPHHARENLRPQFLSSVTPEFVFITNSTKGTKDMKHTLKKNHIPFLYARKGIIHIATDGTTWYVEQLGKTEE